MNKKKSRQHRQLDANIETNLLQYMDEITKIIVKSVNEYPDNWTQNQKKLIDLYYESFGETIIITYSAIKQIYNNYIKFDTQKILEESYNPRNFELFKRLPLEETILKWWTAGNKQLEDNIASTTEVQLYLTQHLLSLFKNENHIIKNQTIKFCVHAYADILVIEGGCTCGDGKCDEYIGEYPADEQIELPPYHTWCGCNSYYCTTDDIDEIDDLDLDIDEIVIDITS